MRVVDVCAFYSPRGGGVRTYVDRKLKVVPRRGHEMIVVAPGAEDRVEARGPNARIITLRNPPFPLDRRYGYFANEAALHALLDRLQPDFVEASSPWGSAAMVGRWRGAAPRALVMHADPLSAYAYRWFGRFAKTATIDRFFAPYWRHLRRLDEAFDLIVTPNAHLAWRLRDGGLRQVQSIAMGVEPGIFSPRHRDLARRRSLLAACGLPDDARLLIGVGRLAPEKRWDLVIEGVRRAGTDGRIGLLLFGEGRWHARLAARAAGVPHVRINEPITDRHELATVMASADALVHGCDAETFCMVAAEAKASGLPVIVPDRGGAADHASAATDRRYGAGDADALCAAIRSFAARPPATTVAVPPRLMDEHFAELFAAYERVAGWRLAA